MSLSISIPNASRSIEYLLKAIVVAVFLYLIYLAFTQKENLDQLFQSFVKQTNSGRLSYLVVALALVYFNWRLEAVKWRKLMHPVLKMDTKSAFRSVLVGLTTSIFTPNRIGEFVGRILMIENDKKLAGVAVLTLGSLIQLSLLSFGGILALAYLIAHSYPVPFVFSISWIFIISIILLAGIFITNTAKIIAYLQKKLGAFLPAIWQQLDFAKHLPSGYFGPIIVLTGLRILVYVAQYWLLLQFFHIDVHFDLAIATILLGYFIQSGLPLPSLLALVAREKLRSYFGIFLK
ncbi:MAG: flippase-like domain-containing protein [Saprospiraceae bacterium]|nr:flippase-like domain-containing protein [Saprospiraceae bacterium]